jgi:glyoxylase-like metal-dependent hydrolase (beta-lactamase superfamily II)
MDIYGLEGGAREAFRRAVVDEFNFAPRPDANGFHDGAVFDLGGIAIEAVHLPGHTRGHSGFRVASDVFFLSDIDLTGFGPYYGDARSDLEDFEESSIKVRHEDPRYYVTYHHKGVIEGRETSLEMLDAFHEVISRRHEAMLEYLSEPRTIAEMAEHRFINRPPRRDPTGRVGRATRCRPARAADARLGRSGGGCAGGAIGASEV